MTDLPNTTSPARTRYAPSPTGYPHIGNLRTAIFAYLIARQSGGQFLLRIEDTDQNRYVSDALGPIKESLAWLGLEYDEGPDKGGEYGPYVQSERKPIYREFAERLIDKGRAYWCYCSPERLEAVNTALKAAKLPPGYDRHCRYMSEEERLEKIAEGVQPVLRFAVELEGETTFDDLIRGKTTVKNSTIDDRVLLKSDGMPTYNFAHIVDDYLMKITHVVRGEEYIASVPFYIQEYAALEIPVPVLIQVPLVLDEKGQKFSKRNGAKGVIDYKKEGYASEALLNYLAMLGWSYDDHTEIFSMVELIEKFDPYRIQPAPARFSPRKLEWMNGYYLNHILTDEDFARRAAPFLVQAGLISEAQAQDENYFIYLVEVCKLAKQKCKTLVEVAPEIDYMFKSADALDYPAADLIGKNDGPEATAKILAAVAKLVEEVPDAELNHATLEAALRKMAEEDFGIKFGNFVWPPRVAILGKTKGPDFMDSIVLLGRDESLTRLRQAQAKLA